MPHLQCFFCSGRKTNKQKTHKHFSGGPCGTIVPGTNPHPSQGQTGQNGDFTVELNRKRPVCRFVPGTGPNLSRGGVPFVPGTVPVCPGHRPAQNVYVYWFFSCPEFSAATLVLPLPPKQRKLRPWSEFFPPQKLGPWSEFHLREVPC